MDATITTSFRRRSAGRGVVRVQALLVGLVVLLLIL
jgi:hypothetical protein